MSFNSAVAAPIVLTAVLALPGSAAGHCDTLDGPVVKAAQRALAISDPNPALIWVEPADEAEVRDVFARTVQVRQLSAAARELADRYFYETLVRSQHKR